MPIGRSLKYIIQCEIKSLILKSHNLEHFLYVEIRNIPLHTQMVLLWCYANLSDQRETEVNLHVQLWLTFSRAIRASKRSMILIWNQLAAFVIVAR